MNVRAGQGEVINTKKTRSCTVCLSAQLPSLDKADAAVRDSDRTCRLPDQYATIEVDRIK